METSSQVQKARSSSSTSAASFEELKQQQQQLQRQARSHTRAMSKLSSPSSSSVRSSSPRPSDTSTASTASSFTPKGNHVVLPIIFNNTTAVEAADPEVYLQYLIQRYWQLGWISSFILVLMVVVLYNPSDVMSDIRNSLKGDAVVDNDGTNDVQSNRVVVAGNLLRIAILLNGLGLVLSFLTWCTLKLRIISKDSTHILELRNEDNLFRFSLFIPIICVILSVLLLTIWFIYLLTII